MEQQPAPAAGCTKIAECEVEAGGTEGYTHDSETKTLPHNAVTTWQWNEPGSPQNNVNYLKGFTLADSNEISHVIVRWQCLTYPPS